MILSVDIRGDTPIFLVRGCILGDLIEHVKDHPDDDTGLHFHETIQFRDIPGLFCGGRICKCHLPKVLVDLGYSNDLKRHAVGVVRGPFGAYCSVVQSHCLPVRDNDVFVIGELKEALLKLYWR